MLALLTFVIVVYAATLNHAFLSNWDDDKYVTANESIRGFSLQHVKTVFTSFYVGNYAPVQMISYMLDYSFWGMWAGGYLLTNLLVHTVNGILIYVLIIRIYDNRLWAFFAAFIFLFHPVQVESVAWISQRKNLLAMFFSLVAFSRYIAYRERGWGDAKLVYVLSLAAFVAALLAKSVAVILPVILMLYDLCFVEKTKKTRWLLDKTPYLLAAGAVALLAMKSQLPEYEGGRVGYHGGSPLATLFTMLPVFIRYIGMIFWPLSLSAVYSPLIRTGIDQVVLLSFVVLLLLAFAASVLYRKRKDLFFWYVLFFLGLVPVSQLVPLVTLMNDRYLYFPLLGASVFITLFLGQSIQQFPKTARIFLITVCCLMITALPVLSFQRVHVWKNAIILWTDATHSTPASREAWFGLGNAFHNENRYTEAVSAYEKALDLDPKYLDALDNLALLYMEKGDFKLARIYLERAVNYYPTHRDGFLSLANSYYYTGDYGEAESLYRRALFMSPRSAKTMMLLANVSIRMGNKDAARQWYLQASATGDSSTEVLYNMACFHALEGNPTEAMQLLEQALKNGSGSIGTLRTDHDLDSLRSRPDFQRLTATYYEGKISD